MTQRQFPLDLRQSAGSGPEPLDDGALILRGHASSHAADMIAQIRRMARQSPFRRMTTPGGGSMSVAMTCCGLRGWCSDAHGYRYEERDPLTGQPWPAMPEGWRQMAVAAAAMAGYEGFAPDSCLINGYRVGARMGLHQDRDERADAPVVSLSFGLPAIFLWGGLLRTDPLRRIPLLHGDVVVWGGTTRLAFHGIAPLRKGDHPLTGPCRYNLTFRRTA
ncbi:Alpha-ketoglutarate-dependent dioxygenase AlkB [Komagataeibacter saccharivorans]|uniref:Alpha-ketoglutarate-dependent dioxygenase AlkB n=1 Tax=Komagataeibacter saccharivorans TaxID=265959 RepID=A0A347W9B2_9PROT|nr:DNA oxidative demethylase AlkB [Komagataeibacter saccharivorans]AXY21455.1 Alpha-ketoglutarate-dependent dioxygenase AlkB [Komagataeibacter saccharivorans]